MDVRFEVIYYVFVRSPLYLVSGVFKMVERPYPSAELAVVPEPVVPEYLVNYFVYVVAVCYETSATVRVSRYRNERPFL